MSGQRRGREFDEYVRKTVVFIRVTAPVCDPLATVVSVCGSDTRTAIEGPSALRGVAHLQTPDDEVGRWAGQ